jgi:hypothetical protein
MVAFLGNQILGDVLTQVEVERSAHKTSVDVKKFGSEPQPTKDRPRIIIMVLFIEVVGRVGSFGTAGQTNFQFVFPK